MKRLQLTAAALTIVIALSSTAFAGNIGATRSYETSIKGNIGATIKGNIGATRTEETSASGNIGMRTNDDSLTTAILGNIGALLGLIF